MAAVAPRSALVVAIPEAEPVVGRHRARLDANAASGVPAHVTVLFPLVPPAQLDDAVVARVAVVLRAVPAFDYTFGRTDWFGDTVLWPAPENPRPFRDLTARVFAAFPAHPPLEGVFDDVVPHLTVGHEQPRAVLEAAERELATLLPVTGVATQVLLLAQAAPDGPWATRAALPLGVSRR